MYRILNCIKIKKNAPLFKNIRKILYWYSCRTSMVLSE